MLTPLRRRAVAPGRGAREVRSARRAGGDPDRAGPADHAGEPRVRQTARRIDLVLIVVVYVALKSGRSTGMLAGTVAGLIQDALSSGILGIGGLAKTLVGFLSRASSARSSSSPRRCRGSWCFVVATAAARGDFHGPVHAAGPAAVSRRPTPAVAGQAVRQCVRRRGRVPDDRVASRASSTGGAAATGRLFEAIIDTVMAIAEDRRRLATAPHACCGWSIGRRLRPARRRLLVLPGGPARPVQGDGGEQPPAHADRCARRAASSSTAPARCWSRTATPSTSRSSASTRKDLDRTIRAAGRGRPASTRSEVREIVDRHRREPSYRPIVVIQDATLAQVAAVTARRLDFELPDVRRAGSADAPVSRSGALAAHLIGYVGEASEEQMQADGVHDSASIVGQSGVEQRLQQAADGRGRRPARRRQQRRAAKSATLEEMPPVEGRRVQLTINYAMQKAAEDGVPRLGYWGSAIVLEPEDRRSADADEPAGVRSRTTSPPASIARRGRRSTPTSCGRCRTARSRAATRRARRSRSWSRRRRSKRG